MSGDAHLEPTQCHLHDTYLAGAGERHLEGHWQRDRSDQIVQRFLFPAVEAVVVDLDIAIVTGANDETSLYLVIQSCIPHKPELGEGKQCPSGPDSLVNLLVLTHKILALVGEPIGIRDHWLLKVNHCCRYRRIARRQSFRSPLSGWRAFHHRAHIFQFAGVWLLKVDRIQCHYQVRRHMLRDGALRNAI